MYIYIYPYLHIYIYVHIVVNLSLKKLPGLLQQTTNTRVDPKVTHTRWRIHGRSFVYLPMHGWPFFCAIFWSDQFPWDPWDERCIYLMVDVYGNISRVNIPFSIYGSVMGDMMICLAIFAIVTFLGWLNMLNDPCKWLLVTSNDRG